MQEYLQQNNTNYYNNNAVATNNIDDKNINNNIVNDIALTVHNSENKRENFANRSIASVIRF